MGDKKMMQPPWIEITTCFPCPNRCPYCPQDDWIKAYKDVNILTLSNFKKILKNVPKNVVIDFAGFAEPFVNPECADMMIYARNEGHQVNINSTLVGASEENLERVKDIVDEFRFHDANKGKSPKDWMIDTGKVLNPNSRAGHLWDEEIRNNAGECARAPYHNINVMMPNGDVYICCNDYSLKHKLGNLFETNYDDLERLDTYELCKTCKDSR